MALKKLYSPPIPEEIKEMITRIRNMAVCYRLREKEARSSDVFVFNRQNKEKLH